MRKTTDLIPRQVLFDNPDRICPVISPDGTKLAYLAPFEGVLNVWISSERGKNPATNVTSSEKRPIRSFAWAYTNRHILFTQDERGDENFHLYSADISTGRIIDLSPGTRIQAKLIKTSPSFPREIVLSVNDRSPQLHDLYRVDIVTGERQLVHKNVEGILFYHVDNSLELRLARRMIPQGDVEILEKRGDSWSAFLRVPAEDVMTTEPVAFDGTDGAYFMDSLDRNTAVMTRMDLSSHESTVLAADAHADACDQIIHPMTHRLQAVAFNYDRKTWKILDTDIMDDLAYLNGLADGDVELLSRSQDDKFWTVAFLMDNGPIRFYLYDHQKRQAEFLFTNRRSLEDYTLSKMHPVIITARDNLSLVSYYTLPAEWNDCEIPGHPLPLVLWIHGGPWSRDSWGYNAIHQLFANRGYAVMSVNYRGSTGFGKVHINAGNLEWGRKMHEDIIDAVNWAVAKGLADPGKVAITGGSYGGYETLVGMSFSPDFFACGIDLVGPSNLITFMETLPPYWAPLIEVFTRRTGDHRTKDGRKLLAERSPLSRVDDIKRPLLIAQGVNDPRVKQAESDQIVMAMKDRCIPVTYLVYPDEGHGFTRPQNNLSFIAIAEAFLSDHLGGRFEPIGNALKGTSLEIKTGKEFIPGFDQVAE